VRTDRQDGANSRFSLFMQMRLTNAQCQLYRRKNKIDYILITNFCALIIIYS